MDPATLESLIVKEIRKAKEISRRDLAESLGIAKSTAGRRIDSMIDRGIVRESGIEDRKEVGRPRRFLELRSDYGSYAGFDFDARHVYAVLVDFAQGIHERTKIRLSAKPDRDEVLEQIRETLASFRQRSDRRLFAVGIGVPGHVRRETRTGLFYPYLEGWRDVDLSAGLGLDPEMLYIENNTRAVALGEYWLGPHMGADHLLCLSVRTGIAAAVVANGALVAGSHELAGEIRAWTVGSGKDWIENVATVHALTDGEKTGSDRWRDFVASCLEGAEESLEVLAAAARHHGEAVSRMVQLLDPSVVFLSGSFTELEDLYFGPVRDYVVAALDGHYFQPPPIRPTTFGEFSGARGAAALAAAEARLP